jgi:hypothetical protein
VERASNSPAAVPRELSVYRDFDQDDRASERAPPALRQLLTNAATAASRVGAYHLSTVPLWLLIRQCYRLGYNLAGSLGEGVGIDGCNPGHSVLGGPGVDSPLVGRRFLLHP